MFARGSTVKETGRESISTSQEQVSGVNLKENHRFRLMKRVAIWWNQKSFLQASSAEGDVPGQKAGSDITESDDAGKDEQYEEAFSKMKKAAGKFMNFTSVIRFFDVQKHSIIK